jgi:hypothetical protein
VPVWRRKRSLKACTNLELEHRTDDGTVLNDVEYKTVVTVVNTESAISGHYRGTFGECIAKAAHDVPHEFGTSAKAANYAPAGQIEFGLRLTRPFKPTTGSTQVAVSSKDRPLSNPPLKSRVLLTDHSRPPARTSKDVLVKRIMRSVNHGETDPEKWKAYALGGFARR